MERTLYTNVIRAAVVPPTRNTRIASSRMNLGTAEFGAYIGGSACTGATRLTLRGGGTGGAVDSDMLERDQE